MTPAEKISVRSSICPPFTCSGDLYAESDFPNFGPPNSATLSCPLLVKIRLPGFRFRCKMPLPCANSSALNSWIARLPTSAIGTRNRACRMHPSTNSDATNANPELSPYSYTSTIPGV